MQSCVSYLISNRDAKNYTITYRSDECEAVSFGDHLRRLVSAIAMKLHVPVVGHHVLRCVADNGDARQKEKAEHDHCGHPASLTLTAHRAPGHRRSTAIRRRSSGNGMLLKRIKNVALRARTWTWNRLVRSGRLHVIIISLSAAHAWDSLTSERDVKRISDAINSPKTAEDASSHVRCCVRLTMIMIISICAHSPWRSVSILRNVGRVYQLPYSRQES